jgi:hypothetical protein
MNIEEWWPKLTSETRTWLIANNGDAIPADILDEITSAGRNAATHQLADDEIDWIEAAGNGEDPGIHVGG